MGLPSDISQLILTYATKPLYTPPKWVDKHFRELVYASSLANPRAYRWIKKNWARIMDKQNLMKNPGPEIIDLANKLVYDTSTLEEMIANIRNHWVRLNELIDSNNPVINILLKKIHVNFWNHTFLCKCPDLNLVKKIIQLIPKIDKNMLYKNENDEPLKYALYEMKRTRAYPYVFNRLIQNKNPIGTKYIVDVIIKSDPYEYLKPFVNSLGDNPGDLALGILEANIELIDTETWQKLNSNPNPRAYELIKKHDNLLWPYFASNPNSIEPIKMKLDNYALTNNMCEEDISILCEFLRSNPRCTELLDNYICQIEKLDLIYLLGGNKNPRLIDWVETHQEYIGYKTNKHDLKIDILELATNNHHILADRYLRRYPKKLVKFIY